MHFGGDALQNFIRSVDSFLPEILCKKNRFELDIPKKKQKKNDSIHCDVEEAYMKY